MFTQHFDDDEDNLAPLVFDNGSGSCKVGFAGEDFPTKVFSSVVGTPLPGQCNGINKDDRFVGDEAQRRREVLSLQYPIEHGIITDWCDMETIWNYAFHDVLHVNPEERSILLSEAPLNPLANKEKMAQVMFETYKSPAMFTIPEGMLLLYACARYSALIVSVGDGVTYVLPHVEGFTHAEGITRVDFGGRNLTDYLMSMLSERKYSFSTTSDREIVREIKEKCCYVNYANREMQEVKGIPIEEKIYRLPDGECITLGSERERCGEALFEPSVLGMNIPGIHQLVYDSIMKCSLDIRSDLFSNIVLCGGTTLFDGFCNRMLTELRLMAPSSKRVHTVLCSNREICPWIGGSIIASLSSFQHVFIKCKEYEEFGPSIIRRKGLCI